MPYLPAITESRTPQFMSTLKHHNRITSDQSSYEHWRDNDSGAMLWICPAPPSVSASLGVKSMRWDLQSVPRPKVLCSRGQGCVVFPDVSPPDSGMQWEPRGGVFFSVKRPCCCGNRGISLDSSMEQQQADPTAPRPHDSCYPSTLTGVSPPDPHQRVVFPLLFPHKSKVDCGCGMWCVTGWVDDTT